jgi:hypothetical protein
VGSLVSYAGTVDGVLAGLAEETVVK